MKKNIPKKTSKQEKMMTYKKYLVIVESPSKCASIEKYLGEEYHCIASKGHITNIKSLKSIDVKNNFEIKFDLIEKKKNHVENMKNIIQHYKKENIYLATDDDKEGCAIAYHIAKECDLPIETTKKITFNEITKTAIVNALQRPQTINMKTVKSQQARQIVDMLIGFKISPILWKHIYFSDTKCLSAGRCQTISLRLVYENHLKHQENQQEKKYKIKGFFFNDNIEFHLNKEMEDKTEVVNFFEKTKKHNHTFQIGNKKKKTKHAPPPLNTSCLLQMSNMSPKQTMDIAQQLYQKGHITYHRTENKKYSKDFLEKMKTYITKKYNEKYIGNLEQLENKNHLNPHEAIRITCIEKMELTNENHLVNALYKLIWKHTMKSCMADANVVQRVVSIQAPDNLQYTSVLEMPTFAGWCVLGSQPDANDDPFSPTINNAEKTLYYLQSLKQNNVIVGALEADLVEKQKHTHFTESTLIKKLEELHIGRPSTYHLFIETIQEKGYVKKMNVEGKVEMCSKIKYQNQKISETNIEKTFGFEKNKLVIQPLGILCIDFLLNHFGEIFDYNYTKQMEEELDFIENMKDDENWYKVCEKTLTNILCMIKKTKSLKKSTYPLDETHEVVFCKNGPVVKCTDDQNNVVEYLPIDKNTELDLNKLKKGEYSLENIVCFKTSFLGMYEDCSLNICVGQYGPYVKWGINTKSIKTMDKPLNEITLEDVVHFIETPSSTNANNEKILRVLNDEMSVRKGKWGFYVFYKTQNMKTPKFINLKKCPYKFFDCDEEELVKWVFEQSTKKKPCKKTLPSLEKSEEDNNFNV